MLNSIDVKVGLMKVSPSQAEDWLINNNYEKNRKLRIDHVDFLVNEIKKCTFVQGSEISFAFCNNKKVLINGQHTLSAIIKSKQSQLLSIKEHYVYTEDDIAQLYFRYDSHKRRTLVDAYHALGLTEKLDMPRTQINQLGAAVRLIGANFSRYKKLAPDDVVSLIEEYESAGKVYFDAIAGVQREIRHAMTRVSTLSIGLVTLRYAAEYLGINKVYSFWHEVAMDDGLAKNDPRKALLKHLYITTVGSTFTKNRVSTNYSLRYVINCWNAWADDRSIVHTKIFDERSDINIKYTPWEK